MDLRAAVICMTSGNNKAANVDHAVKCTREAAARGARWVMLPEIFSWHGPYENLFENAESEDGPLNSRLAALARELKIILFAGTVGERPGPDEKTQAPAAADSIRKVFNTAYVFGEDGTRLAKYRKIHLFNLIGNDGKPSHCESNGFLSGNQPTSFVVDGFHVGMSICYDLRFPELYAKLSKPNPVDVIAVPSAFTLGTGMYHWELLLRARAVEWQSYVIAANQTGTHAPGKQSFGHAMIVDPWGHKLCDTGNHAGIAYAEISRTKIATYRATLPALANRVPSLY